MTCFIFKIDGRFDVICSGSLLGIQYHRIESNSVGYKTDYEMHSLDFEEFLWAKGYDASFADDLLDHMRQQTPLNDAGIINICYCLNFQELPLKGNYEETKYKLYFAEAIIFTRSHTFAHFC